MTRWFYVGGAVRIVVLQLNWSMTRKSTRARTGGSVTSAGHVERG